MARKDILNKKVLLKLSSFVKFSQNFKSREDNRQWHHIIGLYSPKWLLTYPLVWAIVFTSDYGNARSITGVVRIVSSHTFFFIRYSLGIGWHSFKIIMRENQSVVYETPQAEVINLELEQAVLQGSEKDDPDITIPGMGWDD